jgi:hypothetical protein
VFQVEGYLDSQNSEGALIRGTWLCTVSNTGAYWELLYMKMNDDIVEGEEVK